MANPAANLRVRISADLADIKQGLGLLRGELAKVQKQSAAALGGNQNAFVSGMRRARAELAGFVGAYLSLRGAGILTGIADEATRLRGRIKQAKGDYEAILAIANETRSGLSATVDLYTRVERSTRGQIKNQADLLQLTRSVNQAIQLSFTGVAQGEAAVLQLGQALASGRLGGDELRSIMENAPRLALAIADGMGVAIGQLKALGKDGKLTTDVVTAALLSQSAVIEKEFGQLPLTIGAAFTQLRNSLVDYVGDQDEATGASRRFAQTLQSIAKDLPRYLDPLLNAVRLLIENLDLLVVVVGTRLAAGAMAAAYASILRVTAAIKAARAATLTWSAAIAAMGGPLGIVLAGLAGAIYLVYKRTTEAKRAADEHRQAMAETRDMARQSAAAALEDARAKRAQAVATLQAALAALEEKKARLSAAQDTQGRRQGRAAYLAGGVTAAAGTAVVQAQQRVDQIASQVDDLNRLVDEMKTGALVEAAFAANEQVLLGANGAAAAIAGAGDKAKKAVKGIVDQLALARDATARALQSLDQLYEQHGVGIAEYFTKKRALQEADIDLQIRQQEQEAKTATSSEAQGRALTEIIKLQRERAGLAPAAAREQAAAESELAKQLAEVRNRLLEIRGLTGQAEKNRLTAQYEDLKKSLLANGRTDDALEVDLLINTASAKAQVDQLASQMQQILGTLQTTETSVAAQQQVGMVGIAEGEERLQAARAGSISQLLELRQSAADFLATLQPGSAEAQGVISFMEQLDGNIATVSASMQQLKQQITDAAIASLTNLFTDLVSGTKSAKDALKDFVRGFAQAMAQIAARALATMLILRLMDTLWPGSSQLLIAGAKVGTRHTGGVIGGPGGGIRHNVSPLLFGAAPRYHRGGIAGLGPNEVPTILEKGEEVLTRNDPRHRYNGGMERGGDRTMVKTPIVAIGDRAVADALATAAGEDVVITHVRNNWEKLSRGG